MGGDQSWEPKIRRLAMMMICGRDEDKRRQVGEGMIDVYKGRDR